MHAETVENLTRRYVAAERGEPDCLTRAMDRRAIRYLRDDLSPAAMEEATGLTRAQLVAISSPSGPCPVDSATLRGAVRRAMAAAGFQGDVMV